MADYSLDAPAPGLHMCYLYGDDDERIRTIARWLEGGVEAGGLIEYFGAETDEGALIDQLDRLSPRHPSDRPRAITWRAAQNVYTPDGPFRRAPMINRLREGYDRLHAAGPPDAPIMVTGEMEWALTPGACDMDELIRYEFEVTEALVDKPLTAICQYDAGRFDPQTLYRVLKVHPYMVMNGQILPSPYFDPTDPHLADPPSVCGLHA
ncbi:MAG: MEDS domain-containing protein [Marivibrio sp.]|uniref:MEDS domain-containing protein n=1 Tax=Marivibrio sp. TaxID=2039719 RepID=UPI0032EC7BE4